MGGIPLIPITEMNAFREMFPYMIGPKGRVFFVHAIQVVDAIFIQARKDDDEGEEES